MKFNALLAVLALAANALVTIPQRSDAAEMVALGDFGTTCLDGAWLKPCEVWAAGYLNTTEGTPVLAYQLQIGSAPGGSDSVGVVLLQPEAGGWTVLYSQYGGAIYERPLLSDGPLVHVPAFQYGDAEKNADLLFRWNDSDSSWHAIDLTAWQNGIATDLPADLAIWKGVTYDFTDPGLGLFARTSL